MGDDLTQRGSDRVQAPLAEGAGYAPLPGRRDPAHADPNWFQLDLDDDYYDPDQPFIDPMPTERYRTVVPL